MTLLNGGNVGIGTTSPSYKLHVVGSIYTSTSLTTAGPITVGMSPSPFWNAKFTDYSDGSGVYIGSVQAGGYKYISGNSYYNNSTLWYSDNTVSSVIGLGDGILRFYTNSGLTANTNFTPSERMRIASDGNVGIGTTAPNAKLEVNGNIYTTSNTNFLLFGTNSAVNPYIQGASDNSLYIGNNNTSRIFISGSGNVGIGTTSPSSILHTRSSDGTVRFASSTGNDAGRIILMEVGLDAWSIDGGQANGTFTIRDEYNSATRLVINNTGNVGIGTTNPTAKLVVQGGSTTDAVLIADKQTTGDGRVATFINTNASGYSSYIYIGSSPGTDWKLGKNVTNVASSTNFNIVDSSNNIRFHINSGDGNVGIGTTSPSTLLHLQSAASTTTLRIDNTNSSNDAAILLTDNNNPTGEGLRITYDSSVGDTYFNNIYQSSTNAFHFQKGDFGSGTTLMMIKMDGNVGIGTTSPTEGKLVVANSGPSIIYNKETSQGVNSFWNSSDGSLVQFGVASNHPLLLFTSGSERVRITSGGNVGIGTTAPAARLSITPGGDYVTLRVNNSANGSNGEIFQRWAYVDTTDVYRLDLIQTVTANVVRYNFSMVNNSTAYNDVLVLDRGNVGIGTINPTARLHVSASTGVVFEVDGASASTILYVTASGQVGIGQSSPTNKLDIGISNRITLNASSSAIGVDYVGSTTGQYQTIGFSWASSIYTLVTYWGLGFRATNYASGLGDTFLFAGGAERLTVTHTGDVGIGTITPASRLHVNGNTTIGYSTATAAPSNGLLVNGSVGIGTTSPGFKLDVIGNARVGQTSNNATDARIEITSGGSGNNAYIDFGYWATFDASIFTMGMFGTEGNAFKIKDTGGGPAYDRVVISGTNITFPSSSVGINTTSPSTKLNVKEDNTGTEGFIITNWNSVNTIKLGSDSSTGGGKLSLITNALATNVFISSYGASYLNGGNVGIGTTSPQARLHIGPLQGDTTAHLYIASSNNSYGWRIDTQDSGAGVVPLRIWRRTGGSDTQVITVNNADGNVGIGTTTPAYKLDVTGTIRATADIIAYSDARVKDNVKTITDALTKVTSLRGVSYTRKDSEDKSRKLGVIAQEVLEVLPEVVQQDTSGNYSVAYGNMVGVLIEAIKEQQRQIDDLKYLLQTQNK